MAVFLLCELENSAVIKTTKKGFGLLVGMEFDGSNFSFFDPFIGLFGKLSFLVNVLGRQPEGLKFDEFHGEKDNQLSNRMFEKEKKESGGDVSGRRV